MNYKIINENIIEEINKKIYEISDIKLQRKLWLNEDNDTGDISSFEELMSSLFDDLCFNDYVNEISNSNINKQDIIKLKNMLEEYKEKDSNEKIIEAPEWIKISKQAKLVIFQYILSYLSYICPKRTEAYQT